MALPISNLRVAPDCYPLSLTSWPWKQRALDLRILYGPACSVAIIQSLSATLRRELLVMVTASKLLPPWTDQQLSRGNAGISLRVRPGVEVTKTFTSGT